MAKIIQSIEVDKNLTRELPTAGWQQELSEKAKPLANTNTQVNGLDIKDEQRLNSDSMSKLNKYIEQLENEKNTVLDEVAVLRNKITKFEETIAVQKETAYQEGIHNADAEIASKLDDERLALSKVIDSVKRAQSDFLANMEETLVEIVFCAVVKIMGDIQKNDDFLLSYLKTAINQVSSKEKLSVHLPPRDIQRIEKHIELERFSNTKFEFVSDASLSEGGCIITSNSLGGLDARLESQLMELKKTFIKTYSQNNEASV